MKQNLTREQYDKLKFDCEVQYSGNWTGNRKFVRRGRNWVIVAFLCNDGTPLITHYSVGNVRINGQRLAYTKYLTNPKRPEPFII